MKIQGASDQISTVAVATTNESFNKKCFVVPAKSKGEENIQLLTCFGSENASRSEREGREPEYDSEFHIFDPSKNNNIPLKVEGKISWEPGHDQVSVQMSKNTSTGNEYTFKAEGENWKGISEESSTISQQECSIYEITSEGSSKRGTFWLSCGNDNSEDFDSNSPTSIPLSSWPKTK